MHKQILEFGGGGWIINEDWKREREEEDGRGSMVSTICITLYVYVYLYLQAANQATKILRNLRTPPRDFLQP